MSNITDLNQVRQAKIDDETVKSIVDKAMSADIPPYCTKGLLDLLQASERVVFFAKGVMQHADPAQPLAAAQNQLFNVESLPELQTIKLLFDEEYQYAVHLPSHTTPGDINTLLQKMSMDDQQNLVINGVRQQAMMGGFSSPEDNGERSWLPRPLFTESLSVLMDHANTCTQGKMNDSEVEFSPADKSRITTLAESNVYDLAFSPLTRRVDLLFRDQDNSIFSVTLPEYFSAEITQDLIDLVENEKTLNFKMFRDFDPQAAALKARLASAGGIEIDDDLAQFMKETLEEEMEQLDEEIPDNAVPFRRN